VDQFNQSTAVQFKNYGGNIETKTQKPATSGRTKCKSPSQICVSSHAKMTTTTAERGPGPKQNTTKNHQQHCGGHQPRNARKENMHFKLIAEEIQNKFV
jgi:hypothetical protein